MFDRNFFWLVWLLIYFWRVFDTFNSFFRWFSIKILLTRFLETTKTHNFLHLNLFSSFARSLSLYFGNFKEPVSRSFILISWFNTLKDSVSVSWTFLGTTCTFPAFPAFLAFPFNKARLVLKPWVRWLSPWRSRRSRSCWWSRSWVRWLSPWRSWRSRSFWWSRSWTRWWSRAWTRRWSWPHWWFHCFPFLW